MTDPPGTQTDPPPKPRPKFGQEQPVRGRSSGPRSVDDVAAEAGAVGSVVMSELSSDDFMRSVQEFIDFASGRAWPELEKDILLSEQTLAEQVADISTERAPQMRLERELKEKRDELHEKKMEHRTLSQSIPMQGGKGKAAAPQKGNQNNQNNQKQANDFKKWQFSQNVRLNAVKNQMDDLSASVAQLEQKLAIVNDRFSKVPNESVYLDAFRTLGMSSEAYARAIRDGTDQVMRKRSDGPVLKIDPDAFESSADALGRAFEEIEAALMQVLTYVTASAANDANTIKLYDASMSVDKRNIENASYEAQAGRLAVFERVRLNRYNAVNAVIREVEAVHRESLRKITSPVTFATSVDQFDIGVMYALKLSRLGLLMAASHISTRVFSNVYMDRLSAKEPDVPDLKWVVVGFLGVAILFDLFVLGVAFFVARVLPRRIDSRLLKDFAVDTFVTHTMAGISLFPLADVIQDKRYFDYQVTSMRALRLIRQLCFSVSGFHTLIPYFYLTGPFYMQHKQGASETVL